MPWWTYLLICIPAAAVIAALIVVLLSRCKYVRRDSMLTASENYFYHLILEFLPVEYSLVPQAPMIACFDAKKNDRSSLNRILSKRFDYAIVRSEKVETYPYFRLVTIAAIELDDASHNRPSRRKRDKFVEKICRMNRLPLLRFRCLPGNLPSYDTDRIRRDLFEAIRAGDIFSR